MDTSGRYVYQRLWSNITDHTGFEVRRQFSLEKNPNVAYIGCPDHLNRVVYRLKRTDEADNEEVCP